MPQPNAKLLEALAACLVNARALLDSAKAVRAIGHHNIAYHLATLSLEEMGKRELYQIQDAARTVGDPPTWQNNAVQDHVKKLFWCLYSLGTIPDSIDQTQFFEKRNAAADIHANRLAGLYVDTDEGVLNVPSQAVSTKQAVALINLADVLVRKGEEQEPRDVSQEEIDIQAWFLDATDDPERRKRIFTSQSFERLRELNDVAAWTREMKVTLEAEEDSLKALAEREMLRTPATDTSSRKDRWKIRIRIETSSNSIRPVFLKKWNDNVTWIKMIPVQGEHKKDHLLVEFTLGDDAPVQALWPLGFTLSLRLIIALNLATSGFWWWRQAPNRIKYYESITDLESKHGVELDPQDFSIFQRSVALTEVHADTLVTCLTALPEDPHDPVRGASYAAYLGGLQFLALNCITWRSEQWAFGQFFLAFKGLVVEANYVQSNEPTSGAVARFLDDKYPSLDRPDHKHLVNLSGAVEAGSNPAVKLADVYLMKLLCETMFRDNIAPTIVKAKRQDLSTA